MVRYNQISRKHPIWDELLDFGMDMEAVGMGEIDGNVREILAQAEVNYANVDITDDLDFPIIYY